MPQANGLTLKQSLSMQHNTYEPANLRSEAIPSHLRLQEEMIDQESKALAELREIEDQQLGGIL